MPIDPWEYEDDAPLPGLVATRHAVDRARERRISDKEVLRAAKRAPATGGATSRVTTGGGTTAVVGGGKVVTVFRAARPSAYVAPHKRGVAVKVPRCLIGRSGRERIRGVEVDLGCHIQVPSVTSCDPVLVEVTVTGERAEEAQGELVAVLGPWKVVDDVPPGTVVGPGGRMIKHLRTLVPRCEIHVADRLSKRGEEQDKRTVLRGTPERMEAAHTLIRKLGEYRGIAACPACGQVCNDLKKCRKHAAKAHASDGITDEMMHSAGVDRLAQILSDPAAERAEIERRRFEKPFKVCGECNEKRVQVEYSKFNWDLPEHSVRKRLCIACTDKHH
jgi:hypothetical protein